MHYSLGLYYALDTLEDSPHGLGSAWKAVLLFLAPVVGLLLILTIVVAVTQIRHSRAAFRHRARLDSEYDAAEFKSSVSRG